MRAAGVGMLVGVTVAVLWSCTIDRPSDSLKCSTNADCDSSRVCEAGYCVLGNRPADARGLDAAVCPAICGGRCDFTAGTCGIIGTGGSIVCPAGWNCNIECPSAGACTSISCGGTSKCTVTCIGTSSCGSINCTTADCTRTCTGAGACSSMNCAGGDCTQTCSGSGACGSLNCGSGKCQATCQGADPSCGTINCGASCGCDVTCGSGNTCPSTMTCPTTGNGANQRYCSETGQVGDACSFTGSANIAGCNTCL